MKRSTIRTSAPIFKTGQKLRMGDGREGVVVEGPYPASGKGFRYEVEPLTKGIPLGPGIATLGDKIKKPLFGGLKWLGKRALEGLGDFLLKKAKKL